MEWDRVLASAPPPAFVLYYRLFLTVFNCAVWSTVTLPKTHTDCELLADALSRSVHSEQCEAAELLPLSFFPFFPGSNSVSLPLSLCAVKAAQA